MRSLKRCGRCQAERETSQFGGNRSRPDGLNVWCRECLREYEKARRSDPEVMARRAELARVRRTDPAVQARNKIRDATYRLAYPEKRRVFDSDPVKRAKDKARMASPRGRELRRLTEQRRRARLAQVENTLTTAEWDAIKDRFQHRCCYCLAQAPLTVEHLIPISQGGEHAAENVVPACLPCNQRKNARGLIQAIPYLMRSA